MSEGAEKEVNEVQKLIQPERAKEFSITDEKGRELIVRKPGMLAQFRLVGMLGKKADSETYLNMCAPLIYLKSIDGDSSFSLNTEREMEALIQRLDEEGMEALTKAVGTHFGQIDLKDQDGEIKK